MIWGPQLWRCDIKCSPRVKSRFIYEHSGSSWCPWFILPNLPKNMVEIHHIIHGAIAQPPKQKSLISATGEKPRDAYWTSPSPFAEKDINSKGRKETRDSFGKHTLCDRSRSSRDHAEWEDGEEKDTRIGQRCRQASIGMLCTWHGFSNPASKASTCVSILCINRRDTVYSYLRCRTDYILWGFFSLFGTACQQHQELEDLYLSRGTYMDEMQRFYRRQASCRRPPPATGWWGQNPFCRFISILYTSLS